MLNFHSRLVALAVILMAGTAQAQRPIVQLTPDVPATQQEATPPNGVARGVIRPDRPVDSKMVTKPPAPQRHRMPVITPPGTAR
jgi:hypothetical protein